MMTRKSFGASSAAFAAMRWSDVAVQACALAAQAKMTIEANTLCMNVMVAAE